VFQKHTRFPVENSLNRRLGGMLLASPLATPLTVTGICIGLLSSLDRVIFVYLHVLDNTGYFKFTRTAKYVFFYNKIV